MTEGWLSYLWQRRLSLFLVIQYAMGIFACVVTWRRDALAGLMITTFLLGATLLCGATVLLEHYWPLPADGKPCPACGHKPCPICGQ